MPQILIGKDDHGNPTGQFMVGEGGPVVNSLAEAQALGGYLQAPGSGGGSAQTTGRDWGIIAGIFLGFCVLAFIVVNYTPLGSPQKADEERAWREQISPAVRHQRPARYQPAYLQQVDYSRQPTDRQEVQERSLPPGCWRPAPGQVHCPPIKEEGIR